MIPNKFTALILTICALFAASCLNAATIPAGTTVSVSTVSLITSQDAVGSSFEAKVAQDVSVKGNVVLKAGTKASGKIAASRANPRKNTPQSLELTSVSVNGRKVAIKTDPVEPGVPTTTGRQARYGYTAGTLTVTPGTKMQFRLAQAVTL